MCVGFLYFCIYVFNSLLTYFGIPCAVVGAGWRDANNIVRACLIIELSNIVIAWIELSCKTKLYNSCLLFAYIKNLLLFIFKKKILIFILF